MGSIGPWTDVYSFAVVLLEALLDRRVRTSENFADLLVEVMDVSRTISPRKLGLRLGDPVERVFASAFSVRPDQRPKDMGTFWTALKDAVASTPAVFPPGDFEDAATKTDFVAPYPDEKSPHTSPLPAAGNPPPKAMAQTLPLASMRPAAIAALGVRPSGAFSQTAPLTARVALPPQPQPQPPAVQPPAPPYAPPQTHPAYATQPPARERPSQPNFDLGQGAPPEAQRWTPPPYTPPQPPQPPPPSMTRPATSPELEAPPPTRSAAVTVVLVFIVLATLASLGILAYVLVLPRLGH